MTSDAALLKKIYEDEETDNIIYFIREELMDRVMTECYRSYIKKQTVKFIVQCAYDALVKFLCINFYYHCEPPDADDPLWMPDLPIEPSPKDTWAHSAVPIRPYKVESDVKYVEAGEKFNKKESSNLFLKECMCLHVCNCMDSELRLQKVNSTPYEKPCPSKVKFSPKSSNVILLQKIEIKEERRPSKTLIDSVVSSVSSTIRSAVDTSRSQSEVGISSLRSKNKLKKTKEKSAVKDYRVEIPPATEKGSLATLVKLPPIRVNTKLSSKPETSQKKGKNKRYAI